MDNNTIKKKIKKNRKILENFSYLSILQFFNMALPLVTYPYLIKILGAELYGMVILAQVIVSYASIVINFGFEASATKDISINRDNKLKLSEIISSVFLIKTVLWIICFLILLTILYTIPSVSNYKLLYLFAFTITFNELLFPVWYFQGTEKMKYITFINVGVRCLFLLLIFVFIKEKDDYLYVPLLHGIGAFLGGLVALYIVFIKDANKFVIQPIKTLYSYAKDSFPIFLSNIVISIKDRFSVIFIGSFLGMTEVTIYDLGVKIMSIIMQVITVANNAIYPKVAREKNMNFVKKFAKYSFLVVTAGVLLLQPFLGSILDFLSNNLEGTLVVCQVLLLSPIIFSISFPLARNCIIALGYYRYSFINVLITTSVYLAMIGTIYVLSAQSVIVFAVVTVLTYLTEVLFRIYVCKNIIKI